MFERFKSKPKGRAASSRQPAAAKKSAHKSVRPKSTGAFGGVSVRPGKVHACSSVRSIQAQRFLSREAPMLPLPDCQGKVQCRCVYVHFDDRRSDPRRGTDVGLYAADYPSDLRIGQGRRATDRH